MEEMKDLFTGIAVAIVTAILGIISYLYKKIVDVVDKHDTRIDKLEKDVALVKQDVIHKQELTLSKLDSITNLLMENKKDMSELKKSFDDLYYYNPELKRK